jgi:hypothetical protein
MELVKALFEEVMELVNPHSKRGHGKVPSRPLWYEGRLQKEDKGEDRRVGPACFQDRSRPRRSGFRREEVGRVPPSSAASLPPPSPGGGRGEWLVEVVVHVKKLKGGEP